MSSCTSQTDDFTEKHEAAFQEDLRLAQLLSAQEPWQWQENRFRKQYPVTSSYLASQGKTVFQDKLEPLWQQFCEHELEVAKQCSINKRLEDGLREIKLAKRLLVLLEVKDNLKDLKRRVERLEKKMQ